MTAGWSVLVGLVTVLSILAVLALLFANAGGVKGEQKEHVWDDDLREENNPMPRWWLWLFVASAVFGFVYLQLFPGVGSFEGSLRWTQEQELARGLSAINARRSLRFAQFKDRDVAALAADPAALDLGRKVFAAHCTGCHGQDATGAIHFPNLADADWLYGREPHSIEASIAQGRRGRMPAFGQSLDAATIALLADTVTHWSDAGPDAARRTRGLAEFGARCASCHGAEGHGNPALGAPDLTDDVWLHGGEPAQVQATIAQGRASTMPAHASLLALEEIRAVAAYVMSLGPKP